MRTNTQNRISKPIAMIAIGYPGAPDTLPEPLAEREVAPRERKPLASIVFGARWGESYTGLA